MANNIANNLINSITNEIVNDIAMPLETHTSYVCHALSKLFEYIPIYFEMWAENVHTN